MFYSLNSVQCSLLTVNCFFVPTLYRKHNEPCTCWIPWLLTNCWTSSGIFRCAGDTYLQVNNLVLERYFVKWNCLKSYFMQRCYPPPWTQLKMSLILYLSETLYLVRTLASEWTVLPCLRSPTIVIVRPFTVPISSL